MTADKKFAIIITLFAVIGFSLAIAMLSMVLLDGKSHSDGVSSAQKKSGLPLQRVRFFEK
jgi:hypothetical protein